MKKLLFLSIFFSMHLADHTEIFAQIHDFDSLIQHNDAFRQVAESVGDTLDLFSKHDVLEVTLKSDFKNLIKRKHKDEYQEASFQIMFNDTVLVTREIKIAPRGKVRRSTCMIPPLKLNFPKKKAFIKQLESFDKLKMVLDCKRGIMYEQYLLSEYYAYRIQNIITDYSMRVRLMHVNYVDVSGKFKNITRYAFVIESIDQLAARKNAVRIKTEHVRDIRTHIPTLADAYLFQYLIGNTDWSIPAMHNIYLIKSTDPLKTAPYVIPYDFDYAGIVNAIYAVPDENLGTKTVKERVYRGVCMDSNPLYDSRARLLNNKAQIYQLYDQDILLSKGNKRNTVIYLDEFFKTLESDFAFDRRIIQSCR
jgi:hypothetical protein